MHSSTDQGLDSEDFQEAPSVVQPKGYHPLLIGVAGALFGLILAVVLIRGSMPEMTPEQIVAMEGYEGRQPPRYIFNLESLGVQDRGVSASSQSRAIQAQNQAQNADLSTTGSSAQVAKPQTPVERAVSATDEKDHVSDSAATALSAIAIKTEEPKDTWPLEIVEVPASPIIVGKDAQDVAAPIVEEFDYRKLNRKNVDSVKTSDATIATQASSEAEDKEDPLREIRVLPVLTVNADKTYILAEPSESAEVKMVLARGMSVTAFEQSGAWVYVGANDGSSITGYVHQSAIAATEIN
jgi:hypothetical protein